MAWDQMWRAISKVHGQGCYNECKEGKSGVQCVAQVGVRPATSTWPSALECDYEYWTQWPQGVGQCCNDADSH